MLSPTGTTDAGTLTATASNQSAATFDVAGEPTARNHMTIDISSQSPAPAAATSVSYKTGLDHVDRRNLAPP